MAGVVGANGMMVGPGGAVGPLSAEGLHAVLLHTFTPDATQRKVSFELRCPLKLTARIRANSRCFLRMEY